MAAEPTVTLASAKAALLKILIAAAEKDGRASEAVSAAYTQALHELVSVASNRWDYADE